MLKLRVIAAAWETPDIFTYDLRSLDGAGLPAFTAGAHVTLRLNDDLSRSYSLLNSQEERHRYVIAVQKDRQSRGGSLWIHQNLKIGDVIAVSLPMNNFSLNEGAEHSLFIAGGIGLTPILSMMDRLSSLEKSWTLLMCARSRNDAPFLDRFAGDARCRLHFDQEMGARLDLSSFTNEASAGSHLYCCGPESMIRDFESLTRHLSRERIHVEHFRAEQSPATDGGFTVVLARSGREVFVPSGKTILGALSDAGIVVPSSCNEGICGTCETLVLSGEPDHRDAVLSDDQRRSNRTIIVCCSGSKTKRLTLDL